MEVRLGIREAAKLPFSYGLIQHDLLIQGQKYEKLMDFQGLYNLPQAVVIEGTFHIINLPSTRVKLTRLWWSFSLLFF